MTEIISEEDYVRNVKKATRKIERKSKTFFGDGNSSLAS